MDQVTWAESTVVQAVLALAGDLAEHLVEPSAVVRVGDDLRALAAAPASCRRRRGGARAAGGPRAAAAVVARYAALKRERELLDFGDVVALAAELARTCPEVREVERATSRVVLLDEYQDTGAAQEVLLSALFGDGPPGDGRRRPLPEHLRLARGERRDAAPLPGSFGAAARGPRTLSTTYRNGGRLLRLANLVSDELRTEGVPVPRCARARPGGRRRGALRPARPTSTTRPGGSPSRSWPGSAAAAGRATGRPGRGRRCCAASARCSRACARPSTRSTSPSRSSGSAGCSPCPEVADLRATLQVLDDPTADAALLRLLTGARWRIGPRDLAPSAGGRGSSSAALPPCPTIRSRRSCWGSTTRRSARWSTPSTTCPRPASATPCRRRGGAGSRPCATSCGPAPPGRPAAARPRRRRRAHARLDVEVSARPGSTDPAAARADLDAFADAAAQFAGDTAQDGTGEAVLGAFLAHLEAAEDEEHGLDTGAVSGADTVKLMTVHAAKGLEWPVVAVPGWRAAPAGERPSSRPGPRRAPRGRPTSACCPSPCAVTAPICRPCAGSSPRTSRPTWPPWPTATPARSATGLRRGHTRRAPAAVLGLPLGEGATVVGRRCSSSRHAPPASTAPGRS
jgi:DNA helicase-2/ATP-dependent DNA helicase PcrA